MTGVEHREAAALDKSSEGFRSRDLVADEVRRLFRMPAGVAVGVAEAEPERDVPASSGVEGRVVTSKVSTTAAGDIGSGVL